MNADDYGMFYVGLMVPLGIAGAFIDLKLLWISLVGVVLLILQEDTLWRSVRAR